MPKKIIQIVTVTGADDSIRPEELVPIAEEYPFVEFGILLSKKQQGRRRFPSSDWLKDLYILWFQNKSYKLSGHLCGEWVRKLCLGDPSFFTEFGYHWYMFNRLQLNFHTEHHPHDIKKMSDLIRQYHRDKPVIFQMEGVNDKIFHTIAYRWGIMAFRLFDQSGGNGIVPKEWPKQQFEYCGYAGGLSPENLSQEMEKISEVASGPIWIDAETLLRSQNDAVFDLDKVRRFLEAAKPWMME
ncbi:MAG: hypothetical protein ABSB00_03560 [Minisyncoccia bacterium]